MKKLIIIISLFFIGYTNVYADERILVNLSKCVDGDTAWFINDNEEIKARFLAIDTPESTIKIEEYGKEASQYTCSLLEEAKKIEIEYDHNSNKTDKYNRHLVWVFVDGELLQEKIIQKGYAEVAYLYDDYKYTNILKEEEIIAKKNKIGLWSEYTEEGVNYIYIIVIVGVIVIICIFSDKFRKKVFSKSSIYPYLYKKYGLSLYISYNIITNFCKFHCFIFC